MVGVVASAGRTSACGARGAGDASAVSSIVTAGVCGSMPLASGVSAMVLAASATACGAEGAVCLPGDSSNGCSAENSTRASLSTGISAAISSGCHRQCAVLHLFSGSCKHRLTFLGLARLDRSECAGCLGRHPGKGIAVLRCAAIKRAPDGSAVAGATGCGSAVAVNRGRRLFLKFSRRPASLPWLSCGPLFSLSLFLDARVPARCLAGTGFSDFFTGRRFLLFSAEVCVALSAVVLLIVVRGRSVEFTSRRHHCQKCLHIQPA